MLEPARDDVLVPSVVATILISAQNGSQSADWTAVVQDLTQAVASDISKAIPAEPRVLDAARAFEVTYTSQSPFSTQKLRKSPAIAAFEAKHNAQVNFQVNNVFRRHKRLAVFDMDSTLIQQEVIDEIARDIGAEQQVSDITERALNGELDWTASLRERCALLKGVDSSVFERLKSVISLSPGAADLVKAFKRLGFKTAVLSGGFTPLTSWQAQQLGLDYAHANNLVVSEDGKTLTGGLTGTIVGAEMKKELLQAIALENGLSVEQVVAVGDGANDLPMLGTAGLGVAFNAKPRVQQLAPTRMNSGSLLDVLYLFGLTTEEIQQLLK